MRKKKGKKWFGLLIAIVFLCAFCVPVAAASKLPRLQVKGTQLVNSSGGKKYSLEVSAPMVCPGIQSM